MTAMTALFNKYTCSCNLKYKQNEIIPKDYSIEIFK